VRCAVRKEADHRSSAMLSAGCDGRMVGIFGEGEGLTSD